MHLNPSSLLATGFLYAMLWVTGSASAQDAVVSAQSKPLPEKVAIRFEQALAEIAIQKEDIKALEVSSEDAEGLIARLLSSRRDRLWTAMFQNTVTLARDVATQDTGGFDVAAYEDRLIAELMLLPEGASAALARLWDRVSFPSQDLPPIQFVVADQKLFTHLRSLDEIFRAMGMYIDVAAQFGLDASEEKSQLVAALLNSAANRSIFLELALDDLKMLKSTVATLPTNTELADWYSAIETRVQLAAAAVREIVVVMNSLGLETRRYRQQVLTVTGEITTDVLDVGIVSALISQWGKSFVDLMAQEGVKFLFRLLLVVAIVLVSFQLAKLVQRLANRALDSARFQISHLLRRMIVSTSRNFIIITGILIAITQLGFSLGPLLAGLGIAGFIIGFALQDSLSNFASGMDPHVSAV